MDPQIAFPDVKASMDSQTIRVATPSDAAAISSLLFEFNRETLSPEELGQRMEQAKGLETIFFGELDGVLAGLLVLRTVPTVPPSSQDWAEITELYVRPAFRRKGVGKALIEAALAHARHHNCTAVHLLVDPQNAPAISFYEAVGFHRNSSFSEQTGQPCLFREGKMLQELQGRA